MNNTEPLKNIRVVLTRPSHPGNIGAAARAMKTMGLCALHLVNPRHFPHPDADARAAGALDLLQQAEIHDSLTGALGDCVLAVATSSRHRDLRHDVMAVREAARELVSTAAAHPVAVVFGNEASGLNSEEASLCQVWAHIPANSEYPSLNLAAAVQVFAYELRLACIPPGGPSPRMEYAPATMEQLEQLYVHFERSMTHTGFYDPASSKRLRTRLRRLLARARLETEEVNILRGFLNSIDKLRR